MVHVNQLEQMGRMGCGCILRRGEDVGSLCKGKSKSRDVTTDMKVGCEVEIDGMVVVRDDGKFDACLE